MVTLAVPAAVAALAVATNETAKLLHDKTEAKKKAWEKKTLQAHPFYHYMGDPNITINANGTMTNPDGTIVNQFGKIIGTVPQGQWTTDAHGDKVWIGQLDPQDSSRGGKRKRKKRKLKGGIYGWDTPGDANAYLTPEPVNYPKGISGKHWSSTDKAALGIGTAAILAPAAIYGIKKLIDYIKEKKGGSRPRKIKRFFGPGPIVKKGKRRIRGKSLLNLGIDATKYGINKYKTRKGKGIYDGNGISDLIYQGQKNLGGKKGLFNSFYGNTKRGFGQKNMGALHPPMNLYMDKEGNIQKYKGKGTAEDVETGWHIALPYITAILPGLIGSSKRTNHTRTFRHPLGPALMAPMGGKINKKALLLKAKAAQTLTKNLEKKRPPIKKKQRLIESPPKKEIISEKNPLFSQSQIQELDKIVKEHHASAKQKEKAKEIVADAIISAPPKQAQALIHGVVDSQPPAKQPGIIRSLLNAIPFGAIGNLGANFAMEYLKDYLMEKRAINQEEIENRRWNRMSYFQQAKEVAPSQQSVATGLKVASVGVNMAAPGYGVPLSILGSLLGGRKLTPEEKIEYKRLKREAKTYKKKIKSIEGGRKLNYLSLTEYNPWQHFLHDYSRMWQLKNGKKALTREKFLELQKEWTTPDNEGLSEYDRWREDYSHDKLDRFYNAFPEYNIKHIAGIKNPADGPPYDTVDSSFLKVPKNWNNFKSLKTAFNRKVSRKGKPPHKKRKNDIGDEIIDEYITLQKNKTPAAPALTKKQKILHYLNNLDRPISEYSPTEKGNILRDLEESYNISSDKLMNIVAQFEYNQSQPSKKKSKKTKKIKKKKGSKKEQAINFLKTLDLRKMTEEELEGIQTSLINTYGLNENTAIDILEEEEHQQALHNNYSGSGIGSFLNGLEGNLTGYGKEKNLALATEALANGDLALAEEALIARGKGMITKQIGRPYFSRFGPPKSNLIQNGQFIRPEMGLLPGGEIPKNGLMNLIKLGNKKGGTLLNPTNWIPHVVPKAKGGATPIWLKKKLSGYNLFVKDKFFMFSLKGALKGKEETETNERKLFMKQLLTKLAQEWKTMKEKGTPEYYEYMKMANKQTLKGPNEIFGYITEPNADSMPIDFPHIRGYQKKKPNIRGKLKYGLENYVTGLKGQKDNPNKIAEQIPVYNKQGLKILRKDKTPRYKTKYFTKSQIEKARNLENREPSPEF